MAGGSSQIPRGSHFRTLYPSHSIARSGSTSEGLTNSCALQCFFKNFNIESSSCSQHSSLRVPAYLQLLSSHSNLPEHRQHFRPAADAFLCHSGILSCEPDRRGLCSSYRSYMSLQLCCSSLIYSEKNPEDSGHNLWWDDLLIIVVLV